MTAKVSSAAFANGSYPLPVKLGQPIDCSYALALGNSSPALGRWSKPLLPLPMSNLTNFCKSAYVCKSTIPLSDFTPVPPNNPSFNSKSCSSAGKPSLLPMPHSDFCAIAIKGFP